MSTQDELERAVERLSLAPGRMEPRIGFYTSIVRLEDLRRLLSERAELLDTVERLRGELADMLEACRTALAYCEHLKTSSFAVEPSHAAEIRAAILKATTPHAGERG